ncbi:hypothetical protein [Staphylococcus delphini]|uniref:hypothetical protein n=1 Tax=Staphylococcus delphini TaxID=53344 RepID=UPI000BBB9D64|nr:hypothetical protein [Staphylococcus delphini]PCF41530.1 hypothetical protein B5B99_01385 [Staphylococcus delphini]PCF52364.1 hypothetical protein B5C03_05870 [Staphylococcus delphini]PCF55677.1 hypothetical protein B5B97_09685 [Staphylococcus delphini]PCF58657.1 hypothetical protein B5C05_09630 [Staphylococcus delphini]
MLYLVTILLIVILAVLLVMNSKINQTRREMTGLPISTQFPIQQKLKHDVNVMIVVSTNCVVCQRIFQSLKNKSQLEQLYLVFKEEAKTVQNFVDQHPHLKKAHIVSDISPQQLFIQTTPLAYTVNQSGTIIKKQAVVSLKELNL